MLIVLKDAISKTFCMTSIRNGKGILTHKNEEQFSYSIVDSHKSIFTWRNGKRIMEQYESRWAEIPQTVEEHVNMIMGRYIETGDVFKCFDPKIGIFPYPKYLEGLLNDKDWDRLNNLIYQENCVKSLSSLMNTDTESRYWAFLEMLEALAVGNIKTLELLLPNKIENVTHIFPLYRPATNMLIGLWRKDNSVLDYAVPRAKKFVSGKRPQWERATAACRLLMGGRTVSATAYASS